jgi:hypothetical protein
MKLVFTIQHGDVKSGSKTLKAKATELFLWLPRSSFRYRLGVSLPTTHSSNFGY